MIVQLVDLRPAKVILSYSDIEIGEVAWEVPKELFILVLLVLLTLENNLAK